MSTPRFGYHNIYTSAVVSATAESAAGPKENAYDWAPYDFWQPASTGTQNLEAYISGGVMCSYGAIFRHNLGSKGSRVTFQYGSTGSDWTNAASTITPDTDDPVIFKVWSSTTQPYWRISIASCTVSTFLTCVSIGNVLSIPRGLDKGFVPPGMAGGSRYNTNISDTGLLLGRSVKYQALETRIGLQLLDPDWVRGTLNPFFTHAETKPFFFSWDMENYPDESAFCWIEGRRGIRPPRYSDTTLMRADLNIRMLDK